MSGRDGTGPNGQGSMSGRGMGFCNPRNLSHNLGQGTGRGMCRGMGRSFYGQNRFCRNPYPQNFEGVDAETNKVILEQRKSFLEIQLGNIKKDLAAYTKEPTE